MVISTFSSFLSSCKLRLFPSTLTLLPARSLGRARFPLSGATTINFQRPRREATSETAFFLRSEKKTVLQSDSPSAAQRTSSPRQGNDPLLLHRRCSWVINPAANRSDSATRSSLANTVRRKRRRDTREESMQLLYVYSRTILCLVDWGKMLFTLSFSHGLGQLALAPRT